MTHNYLPPHIKPEWFYGLTQRLQSAARSQGGHAIVQIAVVVGPSGEPIVFLEPIVKRIEPMRSTQEFFEKFLSDWHER